MTQPTRLSLFNTRDPQRIGKLFFKLREQPYFFDQRHRDDPPQRAEGTRLRRSRDRLPFADAGQGAAQVRDQAGGQAQPAQVEGTGETV